MTEMWRPVIGYEGLYEASNLGRVRRVGKAARTGKGHGGGARIGLILKPQKHRGGYLAVQLWKLGKMKRPLLHCVVAASFIGPRPTGKEVNHIDGKKHNNEAANLEYVTRSENGLHAYRIGLKVAHVTRGEKHYMTTLTNDEVLEMRRRYVPYKYGAARLAKEFGVNVSTASRIITRKTWSHI